MLFFEETGRQVEMAGRVADFCPICRDLRPFTVRTRHLVRENVVVMFGFPFFDDQDATEDGVDRVCEVCNLDLPANPLTYQAVLDDPDLTLEELIVRTYPELRKVAGERLALEARIRSGTLTSEERRSLLLEPFRMLAHRVRAALGEGPGPMLVFALVAVPLSIVGLVVLEFFPARAHAIASFACWAMLVAHVLMLIRFGIRHVNRRSKVSRVVRLEVYPLLGRALKPLNPSASELEEILETLREEKVLPGAVLQIDRILAEKECLRPR